MAPLMRLWGKILNAPQQELLSTLELSGKPGLSLVLLTDWLLTGVPPTSSLSSVTLLDPLAELRETFY